MDRFDFYKELYFREHDRRNEINDSLSQPIGIATGVVAALFYFLTTFDYKINITLAIIFLLLALLTFTFISISIFHLIKSYVNLHIGFDYTYLADTSDLEKFYSALKKYYKSVPGTPDRTDEEFEQYIRDEMIKNTDANQKTNKKKSFHRHMSQRNLVFAFPFLIASLIPFAYNYSLADKTQQNVSIRFESPLHMEVDSSGHGASHDTLNIDVHAVISDSNKPIEKPVPPKSQEVK